MLRRLRAAVCVLRIAAGPAIASFGAEAEAPSDASLKKLLWDKSLNLRAGVGYKDNVTLSSVMKQGSAFASTGFDFMLFRLPVDGPEVLVYLTGDDYRFLGDAPVDKEQSFIAVSRVRQELGGGWKAGLGLRYLYQNQVFDVSTTEADLTTVKLKGHGVAVTPSVERALSGPWRLKLEVPITRQFLAAPLDDYWEGGPKLGLERRYGHGSSAGLSYEFNHRVYDERRPRDRFGARSPGGSLAFESHEIELQLRHVWDAERHWRSDLRSSIEFNGDNGAGYFDYRRYRVSGALRYQKASWMTRGRMTLNHYDYTVQRARRDRAETRSRTTLGFTVRLEKKLAKKLTWFTEGSYEETFSNRSSNAYRANSVLTGIDWEL